MKKTLMIVAMGAVMCSVMTSCDGEDDNKDGGFVTPTKESDFGGSRLVSVGSENYYTNFSYNSDGSLSRIWDTSSDDNVTIDYTNGTITFNEYGSEDKSRFTTNEKGYITGVSQSGSDEDGKWDVSCQFQYDGSDHITYAAVNQVYTGQSTKENETTEITWEFTWNGDLLSSVKISGRSQESEGSDVWGKTVRYTYTDAIDNIYKQYTSNVISTIDFDGDIEDFMYVGLFGKGSSKYPSEIIEENDGEQYKNVITYELNSKGLVERESNLSVNGNGYSWIEEYTYDNISKSYAPATGTKAGVGRERQKNSRHHHISIFGRRK